MLCGHMVGIASKATNGCIFSDTRPCKTLAVQPGSKRHRIETNAEA